MVTQSYVTKNIVEGSRIVTIHIDLKENIWSLE